MPWLSEQSYPLPEVDLVSFSFGNTSSDYNDDKPVCPLFFVLPHGMY